MTPGARLVLLGRQGSGKGTQCTRLSRHYVVPHISTGDILRAAVRDGTEFGLKAREIMDAGNLVPDDVIVGIMDERLERDDTRARGFILDGFPRTVMQAEALERMTAPRGLDVIINLDLPREVALERLVARLVCADCGINYSTLEPPKYRMTCDNCGGDVVHREDDTEGAIIRRLDLYEAETAPLMHFYAERGLLETVDAMGTPDAVTDRLVAIVDTRRGT